MAKKITNETRSTSLKKFRLNPEINNGIAIGALVDVSVSEATIKTDSSMVFYRGYDIPRLNFVFESREDAKGVKQSTYILSYLAIPHTPETIEGGDDAWRWDQMAAMVKHLYLTIAEKTSLSDEDVEKLNVEFDEVDENGIYLEQPPEVVIAAYKKFFDNIVSLFKPGNKAVYKTDDNKDKVLNMKLLISVKGRNINNGDPAFPGYPGEGVVELRVPGVATGLVINPAKGESIIPKAAPTAAPAPSGGSNTGAPTSDIPDFMKG